MQPNIIYEDKDLIVCHKEAGIPVQTAKVGSKDMVSILKNYIFCSANIKGEPYVGLIHRLDQPVEGIIVFAKNPEAAKELSRQITDGSMKKYYYAVVNKEPKERQAILVNYLLKDARTNSSRVVSKSSENAKRAELSYCVIDQKSAYSLLDIELITGRHHQIRVQMANAGLPLMGDRKYNPEDITENNLALCAYKLFIKHPKTKKEMKFEIKPKGAAFQEIFSWH